MIIPFLIPVAFFYGQLRQGESYVEEMSHFPIKKRPHSSAKKGPRFLVKWNPNLDNTQFLTLGLGIATPAENN